MLNNTNLTNLSKEPILLLPALLILNHITIILAASINIETATRKL